jgi:hypothetical protein
MLKSALLIKQRKIVEGHMYKIVLSQTKMVWFGLFCLKPLSTIFQLYRAWWSILLVVET